MTISNIHRQLIEQLQRYHADKPNELVSFMANEPIEKVARMMFMNFRGGDTSPRGLRLTNFGLMIMKQYFRFLEIRLPSDYHVVPRHILYLDKIAKFPYYYSREYVVLFETQLGVRLRLADGNIDTLMEVDRYSQR